MGVLLIEDYEPLAKAVAKGLRASLEVALTRPRPAEELRATIEDGLQSTRHMQGLVEALLVLARLEAGHVKLNPESFDLVALLRHCGDALVETAGRRRVTVSWRTPGIRVRTRTAGSAPGRTTPGRSARAACPPAAAARSPPSGTRDRKRCTGTHSRRSAEPAAASTAPPARRASGTAEARIERAKQTHPLAEHAVERAGTPAGRCGPAFRAVFTSAQTTCPNPARECEAELRADARALRARSGAARRAVRATTGTPAGRRAPRR